MSGFNKKITSKFEFIELKQKDPKYGGVPAGKHFFVLGFGWDKLPARTMYGSQQLNRDQKNDYIVHYNKCQMIVPGETTSYFTWHFTGDSDPVVSMGYANDNGTPVKYNDTQIERIAKIYGKSSNWAKAHGFVEPRVHVPMWKIEQDENDQFDATTMQPCIVAMTDAQLDAIIKACASLEDMDEKRPFGWIVKLVKDPTKGMDAYQWSLMTRKNYGITDGIVNEEMLAQIKSAITWNLDKLTKIYDEINGGDADSETIWIKLEEVYDMSRQAIDEKFNIRKTEGLKTVQTVNLGAASEAKAKEGKLIDPNQLFGKEE